MYRDKLGHTQLKSHHPITRRKGRVPDRKRLRMRASLTGRRGHSGLGWADAGSHANSDHELQPAARRPNHRRWIFFFSVSPW
jgi:hypothetical protein